MLVLKYEMLATKDAAKYDEVKDRLKNVNNVLAEFLQEYASSVTQGMVISGDDEEEMTNLISKLETQNQQADTHLKGVRACLAENSKIK